MSRRFMHMMGSCKFCAMIVYAAIMLLIYCVLAWWILAVPTPAIEPHTPAVIPPAPLNDE